MIVGRVDKIRCLLIFRSAWRLKVCFRKRKQKGLDIISDIQVIVEFAQCLVKSSSEGSHREVNPLMAIIRQILNCN